MGEEWECTRRIGVDENTSGGKYEEYVVGFKTKRRMNSCGVGGKKEWTGSHGRTR